MDANSHAIARGFTLPYLVGRVKALMQEGCSTELAIEGICEGHELPLVQEQELREQFQHYCSCCGEGSPNGVDCCSDDFPEPGDIREWS